MGQKETKAKVPNCARPPGTDENGERAITGQRLALPAKTKFGTLEASDEHLFKDVTEGRPTAVAKDRMGRFQDGVCSRKRRKDQAGFKTVRGHQGVNLANVNSITLGLSSVIVSQLLRN